MEVVDKETQMPMREKDMSREVRMVTKNWNHPVDKRGRAVPLFDSDEYEEHREWWQNGEMDEPDPADYMPDSAERTHYQMYETVSEGTPISPPMTTKEALARWLEDHDANACAGQVATYEE